MAMFDQVIKELGEALAIDLKVDEHECCLLKIEDKLSVQIEMYQKTGEHVLVGSLLGELAAGSYRENILKEALVANGFPYPQYGIFAYVPDKNQLILYDLLKVSELNGEKFSDHLVLFVKKAKEWQEAIGRGDVPQMTKLTQSNDGGVFGIAP